MNDIELAKLEVFIEQTKTAVLGIVGSRFDAIKARLPQPTLNTGQGAVTAHVLKCWPRYFEALWTGQKRAEVRVNDRNYQPGDYLLLQEYDPHIVCVEGHADEACSGRWIVVRVDHVSDLDAVVAKNVVLLTLQFGVCGDGLRIYDHAHGTAIGANDARYRDLCQRAQRWAADLLKRMAEDRGHPVALHDLCDASGATYHGVDRTYRPTVARNESRGDERDPETWVQPSPVLEKLAEPVERRVPVGFGAENANQPAAPSTVPVHYVRPNGGGSYANVRVADLAAVAMEAAALNPPRNREYSDNEAWDRVRKAFEMDDRRYQGGPVS